MFHSIVPKHVESVGRWQRSSSLVHSCPNCNFSVNSAIFYADQSLVSRAPGGFSSSVEWTVRKVKSVPFSQLLTVPNWTSLLTPAANAHTGELVVNCRIDLVAVHSNTTCGISVALSFCRFFSHPGTLWLLKLLLKVLLMHTDMRMACRDPTPTQPLQERLNKSGFPCMCDSVSVTFRCHFLYKNWSLFITEVLFVVAQGSIKVGFS